MKMLPGFAMFAACTVSTTASANLIISEVMFDPFGGNEHEYVEIYNSGPTAVDLGGYALGDFDFNRTVLPSFSLPAGGTAVPVRIDSFRTLDNYTTAWGSSIPFVATTASTWPVYTNVGDTVTLYASEADLLADQTDSNTSGSATFGRAVDSVNYDAAGFPVNNDSASIYLENVTVNNDLGSNWSLSTAGTDGAYEASTPRASDVGSPGFVVVPEPAALASLSVLATLLVRRRR